MIKVRKALPSVMSLGSLFCGLLSAVHSLEASVGNTESLITASWLIIAAALFDALDGKVSRMFRAQSRFGVEFDSIVDVCSFGFAPAVLAYQYTLLHLPGWEPFAFPLAFIFLACGALRLARFNVQLTGFDKSLFTGIPIPSAAGLLAAFVVFMNTDLMERVSLEWTFPIEWAFPVLQLLAALLMVSTLKYDTFPRLAWDTHWNRVKLVVLFAWLLLAVVLPAETFLPMGLFYVASGLVRAVVHRVHGEESAALDEPGMESEDGEEVLA